MPSFIFRVKNIKEFNSLSAEWRYIRLGYRTVLIKGTTLNGEASKYYYYYVIIGVSNAQSSSYKHDSQQAAQQTCKEVGQYYNLILQEVGGT